MALILVALLSRMDSLCGVKRFPRANPHLLPYLGLRRPLLIRRMRFLTFPGCQQVVRVEREVVHKGTGKIRHTVGYALTSLGAEEADARRLGELLLSRWEVEDQSFWVRDVLLHEDACQVRGVGAQVLAVPRAFLMALLHRGGVREKKAALEALSFHPLSALRFLGLYAVQ